MARYLIKRLLSSALVLLGLSLLAFFVVRLVPGDTVDVMLGLNYDEAAAKALRERLRLDEPLPVQYAAWLGNFVTGDWGQTTRGLPVRAELTRGMAVTLELAGLALLFALGIGLPLGLAAAARQGKPLDSSASVVGVLGLSVPAFWLGTMLILVFSLMLDWLPSGGYVEPTRDLAANLRHMLLPAIALGLAVLAVLMRTTRSAMLEVLDKDHVRTAWSKGMKPSTVYIKHVARNGLIPVLTIAGLQVGYLLGGSIVIEEVFTLPGMGRLVIRALGERDYATLQATILLIGIIFLLVNFLVDMLYAWADPRMSVGES